MKKFFIFVFCFSLLMVGQSALARTKSDALNYIPQLNPTPKYFMTAAGFIDSPLQGKVRLVWIAYYRAFNNIDQCKEVLNPVDAVSVPKEKKYFFSVPITKKEVYEYRIPLDKFQHGFCDWRIYKIDYFLENLENKEDEPLLSEVFFDEGAKIEDGMIISDTIFCNRENCVFEKKDNLANIMPISSKKNYLYSVAVEYYGGK